MNKIRVIDILNKIANGDEIDFMVDKFNELIDEINNLKEK